MCKPNHIAASQINLLLAVESQTFPSLFIFNFEDKSLLYESPFIAITVVRSATKLAVSISPRKNSQAVNLYKPKQAYFHNKSNNLASIKQRDKALKAGND
ncbi:hypothetical protein [Prochlorococcus marinus]|uniref:hypothetical protein n=1 Tax=Prochlorococcus TaxID=1218 RepID=UPI0007B32923|nr:hypothetical protein [Prochlorococcus marinus]